MDDPDVRLGRRNRELSLDDRRDARRPRGRRATRTSGTPPARAARCARRRSSARGCRAASFASAANTFVEPRKSSTWYAVAPGLGAHAKRCGEACVGRGFGFGRGALGCGFVVGVAGTSTGATGAATVGISATAVVSAPARLPFRSTLTPKSKAVTSDAPTRPRRRAPGGGGYVGWTAARAVAREPSRVRREPLGLGKPLRRRRENRRPNRLLEPRERVGGLEQLPARGLGEHRIDEDELRATAQAVERGQAARGGHRVLHRQIVPDS